MMLSPARLRRTRAEGKKMEILDCAWTLSLHMFATSPRVPTGHALLLLLLLTCCQLPGSRDVGPIARVPVCCGVSRINPIHPISLLSSHHHTTARPWNHQRSAEDTRTRCRVGRHQCSAMLEGRQEKTCLFLARGRRRGN